MLRFAHFDRLLTLSALYLICFFYVFIFVTLGKASAQINIKIMCNSDSLQWFWKWSHFDQIIRQLWFQNLENSNCNFISKFRLCLIFFIRYTTRVKPDRAASNIIKNRNLFLSQGPSKNVSPKIWTDTDLKLHFTRYTLKFAFQCTIKSLFNNIILKKFNVRILD